MDVKDLYDEPSCSRNALKKATCEKPEPGDSAGGCAFLGAQFSLYPFASCAHVIHAPSTCHNIPFCTHDAQTVICTNVGTNDIIFGGEEKLRAGIDRASRADVEGIFIYSTCVTALIGEDMDAVAAEKEKELGIPVIVVHAPGFVGNDNFGAKVAFMSVFESLMGKKERELSNGIWVNLLGEYDVHGEMNEYIPLLEKLGLHVLCRLSADEHLENVMSAHKAHLTIVVSSRSLVTVARRMKEKWHIPWVSVSFSGKRDIADALRAIAECLKDVAMAREAERIIAEEEARLQIRMRDIQAFLSTKKGIISVTDMSVWRYISLLRDSGISIVATAVDKANDDDTEKAESYLGNKQTLFMRTPQSDQCHIMDMFPVDVCIGDIHSMHAAVSRGVAFLDSDILARHTFVGYDGIMRFATIIQDALKTPVFRLVSKKAPWLA